MFNTYLIMIGEKIIAILIGVTICIIWITLIIVIKIKNDINKLKTFNKELIDAIKRYNDNTAYCINDVINLSKDIQVLLSYVKIIDKRTGSVIKVTDSMYNRIRAIQNIAKNSSYNKKMNNTSSNINKTNTKLKTAEK